MLKKLLSKVVNVNETDYNFILNHLEKDGVATYSIVVKDDKTQHTIENHKFYQDAIESYRRMMQREVSLMRHSHKIVKVFFEGETDAETI